MWHVFVIRWWCALRAMLQYQAQVQHMRGRVIHRRCTARLLRLVFCYWRERSTQRRFVQARCQQAAQKRCSHVVGLALRNWVAFRRHASRKQGYYQQKRLLAVRHRFSPAFARRSCIVAVRNDDNRRV